MAVARNLVVRVGGDVSGLQKSLGEAQKSLKKAGQSMKKTGQTLTRSITLPVIAAGTALGLMTMRVARAADDLNTLSAETGIGVEKLQRMGFAAEQLGTDLDTITSSQDRLVRSVWQAHQGNESMIRSFHELGVEIYDVNGDLRDTDDIFWDVIHALEKIENPLLRDGHAMELLGRSARELNPIIKAGREEFERLADSKTRVFTQEEIDRLDDLAQTWKRVKSRMEEFAMAVALEVEPIMSRLFDLILKEGGVLDKLEQQLRKLIDRFKELSSEQQNFLIGVGTFAVLLGPVLSILGSFAMKLSFLAGWIKKTTIVKKGLGAAIGLIKTPILIAIGAIVALALIIKRLWEKNEDFRDAVKSIWDSIKDIFTFIVKVISKVIEKFVEFAIWIWGKFGDTITKIVVRAWTFIEDKIVGALKVISGILDFFIGLITGDWDRMWRGLYNIMTGAFQFITAKIKMALGIIKDIITGVLDAVGIDWRGAWQGAKDVFASIWDSIVNLLDVAIGKIMGMIDRVMGAVDKVRGAISSVGGGAKNIASGIKGSVGGALSGVKSKIPGLAAGGLVTAPTLALVGEGRESEAVLPLSKLDSMLNSGGGGNVIQIVLDGRVIQEYIDKGFGNKLTAWGGAV